MDYESLLQLAKKNSDNKKEVKRALPTLPPSRSAELLRKQEVEKKRLLDANVAKFLAKQEDDKRRKQCAANQKRDGLLALRNQDSKARKRVKVMNKSAKSADKSVIQDAVGPSDYYIIEEPLCFMSQESLAQEEKFLEKMYHDPHEEKFSKGKANTNRDLNGTKDRVKQALKLGDLFGKDINCTKQRERKKEKACHIVSRSNDVSDEEEPKQKVVRQPKPPPMNYQELLKLAEKLQSEPLKELPVEKESMNRPMTAKQREEYLCEEASRKRKEEGWKEEARFKKMGKLPPPPRGNGGTTQSSSLPRIPKKIMSEPEERSSVGLPRIPKHNSPTIQCPKALNHREGNISSKETSRPNQVTRITNKPPSDGSNSKHSSEKNSEKINSIGSLGVPKRSLDKEKVSNGKLCNSSNSNQYITEKSQSVFHKQDISKKLSAPRQEVSRPVINQSRTLQTSEKHPQVSSRLPSKTTAVRTNLQGSNSKNPQLENSREKTIRHLPHADPRPKDQLDTKPLSSTAGTVRQPAHMASKLPVGSAPKLRTSENLDSRLYSDIRSRQAGSAKHITSEQQRENVQFKQQPPKVQPKQMSQGDERRKQFPPADERRKQLPSENERRKQLPPADERRKQLPSENERRKQLPPADERRKQLPSENERRKLLPPADERRKQFPPADERRKQFPPADVRRKQFPPADVRPKQFPPADVRPKQFPPADVRPKQFPPADVRDRGRIKANMKRRVIESDDDYDSEDADFIDDGPADESGEDYSKYIKEIFGYDKSRYKGIDDSDDRAMESSFQQQLKEEFTSTKLGLLEDLEDIQKEKRREAMLKKKRKLK